MTLLKRMLGATAILLLLVAAYFAVNWLLREPLEVRASTQHSSLSRESCLECHEPIAREWRDSYHFKSLSGPFWARIRDKGFASLFDTLRVPCKNCHAPANVLDLPPGANPALRRDNQALGVDCVSCHVSRQGITGSGRHAGAPHEVLVDDRFRDPMRASTGLCAHCHEEQDGAGKVFNAWEQSDFAAENISCVDCHMSEVRAPIVASGVAKTRRSHKFPGDKSVEMLEQALNASVEVDEQGEVHVRIINDQVGHDLPAGGTNFLIVEVKVRDHAGGTRSLVRREFGTIEWIPGYLDFRPFLRNTRIGPGEVRDVRTRLPAGHGKVLVEFSYRDWFAITDEDRVFARIEKNY